MHIQEIARSSSACRVEATSETLVSQIWFKSDPIDRLFLYRAVQLQLQTDSRDHGNSSTTATTATTTETAGGGGGGGGGWSWFELVVFRDKDATEPLERDGKLLAWRSHGNRTDPLDTANSVSRHFGVVFDRRQALLDILEVRAFFPLGFLFGTVVDISAPLVFC
jgi:hypothetical protein